MVLEEGAEDGKTGTLQFDGIELDEGAAAAGGDNTAQMSILENIDPVSTDFNYK
jgi:hypothetical protein